MNIILIGYRCTGKTSVGNELAGRIGWPFVDTDDLLVIRNGRTIKEIVQQDGWQGFRELEHDVIRHACNQDNTVIATGGGAVLDPANTLTMKRSGTVVWLKATPEVVKARMLKDEGTHDQRPSLTLKNRYDEVSGVLSARGPLYDKAKDFSIDTDHKNVIEITDKIMKKLFGNGRPHQFQAGSGTAQGE